MLKRWRCELRIIPITESCHGGGHFFSLFSKGYRLSPDAAAQSIQFSQPIPINIVLEKQISSNLFFYLIDAGDYYHTVYCCRSSGFLWKAFYGTGTSKKLEQNIDLLTKFWLNDADVGWIVSTSHDHNVKYFEVTYGDYTITEDAIYGTPTVIIVSAPALPLFNMDVGFNATALSQNHKVLYRLDFPMENYHVSAEEQWIAESNGIS